MKKSKVLVTRKIDDICGLVCPKCNGKSRVINSRPYCNGIRRRRECSVCGYKWNTIEITMDLEDEVNAEPDIDN